MNLTLRHEIDLLPKVGPCDGDDLEGCPNQAYFTLLGGSTTTKYCDLCFAEVLLDLVLSNAEIAICQEKEDEQIYRVIGGSDDTR